MRALLIAALVLLLPLSASAQDAVLGEQIAIVDPSGHALDHLHSALRRAERGEGKARLLFYGASHTSSDQYTGYLRRSLVSRFGFGGHGFVLPAQPFTFYDHRAADIARGRGWTTLRVRGRDRDPDHYGLAGVALETDRRTVGSVQPSRNRGAMSEVSRFEIYYLNRPRGGSFDIHIDGERVRRVSTRAPRRQLGYERIDVPEGHHRLELHTRGDGPVRVFGVTMENDDPGIVIDALGVPGARARDQLPWNETTQREHLRRRDPDLVVLAYGTNESGFARLPRGYEDNLRQVVGRVRRAVPSASCLLIGPSEWPEQTADGWTPRQTTGQIIEVQRRVAADTGCGFFDLVAFLGGPGSIHGWVTNDPPYVLDDHVHYNERGHRRLAEVLERALLRGHAASN